MKTLIGGQCEYPLSKEKKKKYWVLWFLFCFLIFESRGLSSSAACLLICRQLFFCFSRTTKPYPSWAPLAAQVPRRSCDPSGPLLANCGAVTLTTFGFRPVVFLSMHNFTPVFLQLVSAALLALELGGKTSAWMLFFYFCLFCIFKFYWLFSQQLQRA